MTLEHKQSIIGELVVRIDANADALHTTFDAIEKRIESLKAMLAELKDAAGLPERDQVSVARDWSLCPEVQSTVEMELRRAAPIIAAAAKSAVFDAIERGGPSARPVGGRPTPDDEPPEE